MIGVGSAARELVGVEIKPEGLQLGEPFLPASFSDAIVSLMHLTFVRYILDSVDPFRNHELTASSLPKSDT